jgi:carboxymethylenebutenolidase
MTHTESVNLGSTTGYLVRADGSKSGVVVIQEWWGLVPHIKDIASRVANAGYTALAPDLYHGKSTVEAEEASHLMQGLDWALATKEIGEAVRYLRDREHCRRVGVAGFCMGGALTMIAAATAPVDAYASFYGFPPKGAAPLQNITAPGILFFGEKETTFSIPDAQAFAEQQQKRGREAEVIVYPGAGHAFYNDARPEAYKEGPAKDAWARTLDLFARTLKA